VPAVAVVFVSLFVDKGNTTNNTFLEFIHSPPTGTIVNARSMLCARVAKRQMTIGTMNDELS